MEIDNVTEIDNIMEINNIINKLYYLYLENEYCLISELKLYCLHYSIKNAIHIGKNFDYRKYISEYSLNINHVIRDIYFFENYNFSKINLDDNKIINIYNKIYEKITTFDDFCILYKEMDIIKNNKKSIDFFTPIAPSNFISNIIN